MIAHMKKLLISLCSLVALALTTHLRAEPLAVGAEAPKVSSVDHTGKAVKLEDVYKKGPTLIFFYPKAHTGGCTKEVCGMRDSFADLNKLGLQVLGVSMDKEADQKSFVEKQNLNFPLLADTKGDVVKAFGVPEMKPGIPTRQSFLVKDGKILWRDLAVKPDAHAENVKKALEEALKTK